MKSVLFVLVFSFATAVFAGSPGNDNGTGNSGDRKDLLFAIKNQTKACAVKLVVTRGDHKVTVGYKSTCDTLKINSDFEAQIYMNKQWYTARITEASETDGGDLDDLAIYNEKGHLMATRKNVPAFDQVLNAMVGGDGKLPEKENN